MTITTPMPSLDAVDNALVSAHEAVRQREGAAQADLARADARVSEALVSLACTACDALSAWDAVVDAARQRAEAAPAAPDLLTRWRGQLDDLRVQAALAEMELRDSSHQTLAAMEQSISQAERRVAGAVREIGSALAGFRGDLKTRLR